jgi:hypothetical protein
VDFALLARDRHPLQLDDQVRVGAVRLLLVLLQPGEHVLEPVDGGQDQRHGLGRHRHPVAELAHQRLGGVRQRFEARQPEEPAGALDGVDEAEDVPEDRDVVRLLLETHEFDIDDVEALVRLGQELGQQVVHQPKAFVARRGRSAAAFREPGQCLPKAFRIG